MPRCNMSKTLARVYENKDMRQDHMELVHAAIHDRALLHRMAHVCMTHMFGIEINDELDLKPEHVQESIK